MTTLKDLKRQQWDLYVGLLTDQQKNDLLVQWYAPDCYFNPIQDLNDNWIISVEEMVNCVNREFIWVKDLPLIIYEAKPFPPL
jgi:hypothetical protein